MKKTLFISIIFALILSCASFVCAADKITANLSADEKVEAGKEFKVTIKLSEVAMNPKFAVTFDSSKVTFASVEPAMSTKMSTDGKTVTIGKTSDTKIDTITLTFKANENLAADTKLNFSVASGLSKFTINENSEKLPVEVATATATTTVKTTEQQGGGQQGGGQQGGEQQGEGQQGGEQQGEGQQGGGQQGGEQQGGEQQSGQQQSGQQQSEDNGDEVETPTKYDQTGINIVAVAVIAIAVLGLGVLASKKIAK